MTPLEERFPTPADAVTAAREGTPCEWTGSIDGSHMRHRPVLLSDGTPGIEQAVFLGSVQEKTILCAWHETPAQDRPVLEKNVLNALDDVYAALRPHLEADIRQARADNYTAPVPETFSDAPELHGTGLPLFGWRLIHPVSPASVWDDMLDVALWNSSIVLDDWLDEYGHIDEVSMDGFISLLRRHGIPAALCAGCEKPITCRHPRWPGIWTTPSDEYGGPACPGPGTGPHPPAPLIGWYTDSDFGAPHRPR